MTENPSIPPCVLVAADDICPDCGVPYGAIHGRWCDVAVCGEHDERRMLCECENSDINWDDVWWGDDAD